MAKVCELCAKRTQVGNNRSHSNRATKRKFLPNLFKKRLYSTAMQMFVTLKVCSRCIKTVAKQTAAK